MKRILCVCSGGGHLTEMLIIAAAMPHHHKTLVTFSGRHNAVGAGFARHYIMPHFTKNPMHLPFAPLRAAWIMLRERPDVLLSTGAEIAIPFFLLGKLAGVRTVYVECSAQVRAPSRTGQLLCRVADLFFVQWKPLLEYYGGRARYAGGLL